MSTLVETRWGQAAGTRLFMFGLRFAAIVMAAFLVAVVILTGLFLANIDSLFAGMLGIPDPILIPVQDNNGLVN